MISYLKGNRTDANGNRNDNNLINASDKLFMTVLLLQIKRKKCCDVHFSLHDKISYEVLKGSHQIACGNSNDHTGNRNDIILFQYYAAFVRIVFIWESANYLLWQMFLIVTYTPCIQNLEIQISENGWTELWSQLNESQIRQIILCGQQPDLIWQLNIGFQITLCS